MAVAAPGEELVAAVSYPPVRKGWLLDDDLSGTSCSTALVSGLVALTRAKYPSLSAREVLRRITYTAQDVPPHGHDKRTGHGVVRPYEALTAEIPAGAPNPVYDRWLQSQRTRPFQPVSSPYPQEEEFVPFRTTVLNYVKIASAVGGVLVPLIAPSSSSSCAMDVAAYGPRNSERLSASPRGHRGRTRTADDDVVHGALRAVRMSLRRTLSQPFNVPAQLGELSKHSAFAESARPLLPSVRRRRPARPALYGERGRTACDGRRIRRDRP